MSTTESLLIMDHNIRSIEIKIESLRNYFKDCNLRNDKNDVEAKHILTLLKMETSSAVAALTNYQAMLAGLEVTVSAEQMNCDHQLDVNESLSKLLFKSSRSLSNHSPSGHNSRSKSSRKTNSSKSRDKSKVPSPKSQSCSKSGPPIDVKSKGIRKSSKSGSKDSSHQTSGKSISTNTLLPVIERSWSILVNKPGVMQLSPTSPSPKSKGYSLPLSEIPLIPLEPLSETSSNRVSIGSSKMASISSTRSSRSSASRDTNTSRTSRSRIGSSTSSSNDTNSASYESGIFSEQQSTSSEHTNTSEKSSVKSSNNSCKCGLSNAEMNVVQKNQVNSTQTSPVQNLESLPVSIDLSLLRNTTFAKNSFRFKEHSAQPNRIIPNYSIIGSPDANENFTKPQFATPHTPKRRIPNPYFNSNPFGRPAISTVALPQATSNNESSVLARKRPKLCETALHTAENISKIIKSRPAPTYPYLKKQEHC